MKSIGLFIGTLVFYLFLVGFVNAQVPDVRYRYTVIPVNPYLTKMSDVSASGMVGTNVLRGTMTELIQGIIINGEPEPTLFSCDGPDSATHGWTIHSGGSVAGLCQSPRVGAVGYIRRWWGEIILIRFPGAVYTDVQGIANNGNVVGSYHLPCVNVDMRCIRSYSLTEVGYREVSVPVANSVTLATGINDKNQIAGNYWIIGDDGRVSSSHGFLLDNGNFTHLEYPPTPGITNGIILADNNEDGTIVVQQNLTPAAFDDGKWFRLSLPTPTPGYTLSSILPSGLADDGRFVGQYSELSDDGLDMNVYPFVAEPEPVVVVRMKKPRKNR